MTDRSVIVLDRSWWHRIHELYVISDDDFQLPFSLRKTGAHDMMESIFRNGEYVGIVREGKLIACGGYRLIWAEEKEGEQEKEEEKEKEEKEGEQEKEKEKEKEKDREKEKEEEKEDGRCAEIHGIVVHPDHRRAGLGREILTSQMKRIRELGRNRIVVGTWEGSAGLQLLQSAGFSEVERYEDPDNRPQGMRTVRLRMDLECW